jgi:hypothetical protein
MLAGTVSVLAGLAFAINFSSRVAHRRRTVESVDRASRSGKLF